MFGGATPSRIADADAIAVLAHVDERGARAVGAAVDVDLVVAEERADIVEIVHRDRRRVERQVGVVLRLAGLEAIERLLVGLHERLQRIVVVVAVERIRLAGAALIDEDDVAIVLHAAEDLADHLGQLGGALAGSAGEEEQRIGLRIGAERRQHDDVQIDLAALLGGAILVDLERAAVGIDGRVVAGARLEPVDRLGRLGIDCSR